MSLRGMPFVKEAPASDLARSAAPPQQRTQKQQQQQIQQQQDRPSSLLKDLETALSDFSGRKELSLGLSLSYPDGTMRTLGRSRMSRYVAGRIKADHEWRDWAIVNYLRWAEDEEAKSLNSTTSQIDLERMQLRSQLDQLWDEAIRTAVDTRTPRHQIQQRPGSVPSSPSMAPTGSFDRPPPSPRLAPIRSRSKPLPSIPLGPQAASGSIGPSSAILSPVPPHLPPRPKPASPTTSPRIPASPIQFPAWLSRTPSGSASPMSPEPSSARSNPGRFDSPRGADPSSLYLLLRSRIALVYFLAFLLTKHSAELLFFIVDVQGYWDYELDDSEALMIYQTYLDPSSVFEINVSDRARRLVRDVIKSSGVSSSATTRSLDPQIFRLSYDEIFQLLNRHYGDFLSSKFYSLMNRTSLVDRGNGSGSSNGNSDGGSTVTGRGEGYSIPGAEFGSEFGEVGHLRQQIEFWLGDRLAVKIN
ncbi:uncharacterized protein BJ171DRAFT_566927 [Polychytrium aggregatum]|uniref:uncharacterized protein n=1 Tax=Polychytrium aggregatum TaxID=110093 RepID=UPI0022FE4C3C|nr:uncharacterized protein BJ171DRAFT_566927 [Polychytrium aggregatum]KAI9206094.1 hypothetical protein BJ171DRAFT_566927 [Polychytrium aggregatum]